MAHDKTDPKDQARQAREHAQLLRALYVAGDDGGYPLLDDFHRAAALAGAKALEEKAVFLSTPCWAVPAGTVASFAPGSVIEPAPPTDFQILVQEANLKEDGAMVHRIDPPGEIERQMIAPFDPPRGPHDFQILVPPGHEDRVRTMLREGDAAGLRKYRMKERED